MNVYYCPVCKNQLYYESYQCTECGAPLGYSHEHQQILALQDEGNSKWGAIAAPQSTGSFRRCRNHELGGCNWLIPADEDDIFCASCRLTVEIPDLSVAEDKVAWAGLERAKRRLLYTLASLELPVESSTERQGGLCFRLLRGTKDRPVLTGHDHGTITINVAEAKAAYREGQRERLGEAYRTPLGHFRHEIGHYYFDRLVDESRHLEGFRALFGDERASYQEALNRHYENGAPEDYEESYISAYATMHPWEDWAETWAHYLHMVDTLETAQSYGVAVEHSSEGRQVEVAKVDLSDFDALMRTWVPVTLAINGMNRSMGLPDAYPFAISPKVQEKLRFVHEVIRQASHHQEGALPVQEGLEKRANATGSPGQESAKAS